MDAKARAQADMNAASAVRLLGDESAPLSYASTRASSFHAMIEAGDGARLLVDCTGAGRTLLCVHGWAADMRVFAPLAQALSGAFQVVRVDLRGHGRSDRRGPFTIDQAASDIAAIAEALGVRDAVAIGWSMGAMVLWRALARDKRFADRISGLVAVDMAPKITNAPGWALGLMQDAEDTDRITDAMRRDWAAFAESLPANVFGPHADPALSAACAPMFEGNDPGAMAEYWASMASADCRQDIAGLVAPMLVVYGAKSRLYGPQTAAWLSGAAVHAEAVAFEDAGHAPHLEQPDAFHRLVSAFAGATELAADPRRVLLRAAEVARAGSERSGDPTPSSTE